MKLPHLKDERGKDQYDRVQVTSASGDGPAGFSASSGVLSPRRRAAEAARRAASAIGGGGLTDAQVSLSPAPSAFDDSRSFDAEAGDTPRADADADEDEDGDIDVDDLRFRVNGIVVDREMKGGAKPNWEYVYQILFQSSTPAGQRVALVLLVMVSLSVIIAVLDSVKDFRDDIGDYLLALEIFFTVVFSVEYILRVACLQSPGEFVFSLLGFIDICAIVPSYLGLVIPSARPLLHLAVLRIFRVMRVFRVLRLARFVDASAALSDNIHANKRRILVFLVGLFTLILVIGCAMYLIEGDQHGFDNIPISLYWTVVTITTVGYGDIAPQTILGRMLATVVMFVGYGIIACPLVLNQSGTQDILTEVIECPRCYRRLHQGDANFCRVCGTALRQPRAKSIKAQRDRRLHLAKLRLPIPDELSSTTSTSKSRAHLLSDDLETETVNL